MANLGGYAVSDDDNAKWKAAMEKVKVEENYMSATHFMRTIIRCLSDVKGYQDIITVLKNYK